MYGHRKAATVCIWKGGDRAYEMSMAALDPKEDYQFKWDKGCKITL